MAKYFYGQATAPDTPIGSLDRRTVLLAASALFIFGSFLGCAIYRILGIGESELYDNLIERYFLALFQKCVGAADVLRVTLDCLIHELWVFAAVFAAGFSPFTPFVSGALLLWRGLLFGFSLTMLQFSAKTGLLMASMIYLCAAFAVCMLLALLSAEAAQFYYNSASVTLRGKRSIAYTLTFFRIVAVAVCDIIAMLFLIYVYI